MTGEGLPKSALVRKGWEFDAVYQKGIRLHGDGFSLILLANATPQSRLGISIHRKLRGAVKRNRIKRIIRESFRRERDLYPSGMDIVVTVRENFALKNPGEVSAAVAALSAKAARKAGAGSQKR
jgi:ribonuclease P protein component